MKKQSASRLIENNIIQTVDENTMTLVNTTRPDHFLRDGTVTISVSENANAVVLTVVGEGINTWGSGSFYFPNNYGSCKQCCWIYCFWSILFWPSQERYLGIR